MFEKTRATTQNKTFFLYFEKSKTYLPLQAFLDVIFRTVVQRFQQTEHRAVTVVPLQ